MPDAPRDSMSSLSALRPEARPLRWSEFTPSQKNAVKEIIRGLSQAVSDLDAEQDQPTGDSLFENAQPRSNQTFLLTGDRGTGKTSLYWTIKRATIGQDPFGKDSNDELKEVRELIHRSEGGLVGRLIWLEPLELELLPRSTNLLAAIVARVEEILSRLSLESRSVGTGDPPIGLLSNRPAYERAISRLHELQTYVSLAWDGNISERAGNLDPDNFAAEQIRAEDARLKLAHTISSVLDQLAKGVSWNQIANPLFVLPIDDFDLDPSHCWQLVRLLRMVRPRRLATIVMGNSLHIETILELTTIGRFEGTTGLPYPSSTADYLQSSIRDDSRTIARNAIRKLIPWNQRFYLAQFTVEESLDKKPRDGLPSLNELFERIPVKFDHPWFSESADSRSLADVFVRTPFAADLANTQHGWQSDPEESAYTGAGSLNVSPRVWHDFWYLSHRCKSGLEPRDAVGEFAGLLIDNLTEEMSREGNLNEKTVAEVLDVFDWRPTYRRFSISARELPVEAELDFEASMDVKPVQSIPGKETDPFSPVFDLRFGMSWKTRIRRGKLGENELSRRQLSRYAALHDLYFLDDVPFYLRPSMPCPELMKSPVTVKWNSIVRDAQSVHIPWLAPPFKTFWDWDWFGDFMTYQNQVWSDQHSKNVITAFECINAIVCLWLAAGTALVDPAYSIVNESSKKKQRRLLLTFDAEELKQQTKGVLRSLFSHFDQLARKPLSAGTRGGSYWQQLRTGWLNRVAVLLMPESGLITGDPATGALQDFAGELLEQDEYAGLRDFWLEYDNVTEIRRLRALNAARFRLANAAPLFSKLQRRKDEGVLVDSALKLLDNIGELAARFNRSTRKDKPDAPDVPNEYLDVGKHAVRSKLADQITNNPKGRLAQDLAVAAEKWLDLISSLQATWDYAEHADKILSLLDDYNRARDQTMNALGNAALLPERAEIDEALETLRRPAIASTGMGGAAEQS